MVHSLDLPTTMLQETKIDKRSVYDMFSHPFCSGVFLSTLFFKAVRQNLLRKAWVQDYIRMDKRMKFNNNQGTFWSLLCTVSNPKLDGIFWSKILDIRWLVKSWHIEESRGCVVYSFTLCFPSTMKERHSICKGSHYKWVESCFSLIMASTRRDWYTNSTSSTHILYTKHFCSLKLSFHNNALKVKFVNWKFCSLL